MDEESMTEEEAEILQEQMEEQAQSPTDGYGYPKPPVKESVYKFFREILRLKDSSKVGNLSAAELGTPKISVRGLQEIAIDVEMGWGLDYCAEYLSARAESILATSDSKKGFLAQLFVTQIKKEQKIKMPSEQKGGWFSKNKSGEGL